MEVRRETRRPVGGELVALRLVEGEAVAEPACETRAALALATGREPRGRRAARQVAERR